MPVRHFVKYTFLQGRSGLAAPRRRASAPSDKREFIAACEDFADGPPAAGVLAGRHARRRRPDAAQPGREPGADPRVPRGAGPERADEVVHGPVLVPGDDQAVGVLGRVAPGGSTRPRQVPVRLPVREDARVVRAARRRALADHAGAHQASAASTRRVDLNTSYSFGLDDQEFVVAFETDNPADFLDLVQRLRTTESSSYTLRDTPTFTCISCSVERALGALDGAALTVTRRPESLSGRMTGPSRARAWTSTRSATSR